MPFIYLEILKISLFYFKIQKIPLIYFEIKTTGRYLHTIEQDLRQAVRNPNIEDPVNPSNLKMAIPLAKSLLMVTDGPAQRQTA